MNSFLRMQMPAFKLLLHNSISQKFRCFSLFTYNIFYLTRIWFRGFSTDVRQILDNPIMKITTHKRKKFKMKKHKTDKRRKANKTLRKKKLK